MWHSPLLVKRGLRNWNRKTVPVGRSLMMLANPVYALLLVLLLLLVPVAVLVVVLVVLLVLEDREEVLLPIFSAMLTTF